MEPLSALVLGRVLERLATVMLAGGAFWMGWRLFLSTVSQPSQTAELTVHNIALKLSRVSPGVFFVAVGGAVLWTTLSQPLTITQSDVSQLTPPPQTMGADDSMLGARGFQPQTKSVRYLTANRPVLERWIQALNTMISIASISPDREIPQPDRVLIHEAAPIAIEIRNELLILYSDKASVAMWKQYRQQFRQNPQAVPEDARSTVQRLEQLAQQSLFEDSQ